MVIFASIFFAVAAIVIISFILLYQKRRHLHKLEIQKLEQAFTKEMLRSQVEIKDQTLRRVASEIHDNFSPTLSVINISLASLLPKLPAATQEALLEAKILVKQVMSEMKVLSSSLNSDHLMEIGFYCALEKYIAHIRRSGIYQVSFSDTGSRYAIQPEKEIILFRICQEILNNIIKHAHATQIDIHIEYGKPFLLVEIKDNGTGFDVQKTADTAGEKDSTGMGNIRKRAQVLEADLEIDSTPGRGTRITIKFRS
jgi:signal transduction histidine kinase